MRHAPLAEALDIIRQLWTGEVVTYEGTFFTVHDAKLFTRPKTPPDILVSGFGPEATKLAAATVPRLADPAFAPLACVCPACTHELDPVPAMGVLARTPMAGPGKPLRQLRRVGPPTSDIWLTPREPGGSVP